MAVPDVLTDLGVTPRRAFARAGMNLRVFMNPENRVPFGALADLLSVCADLTAAALRPSGRRAISPPGAR